MHIRPTQRRAGGGVAEEAVMQNKKDAQGQALAELKLVGGVKTLTKLESMSFYVGWDNALRWFFEQAKAKAKATKPEPTEAGMFEEYITIRELEKLVEGG
jgi:hypothetical protein